VAGVPLKAERLSAVALADELATRLRSQGTRQRAEQEKRYLKSDLKHLGMDVGTIRREAKAFHRRHPQLTHRSLVGLIRRMWNLEVHEMRMAVVDLLKLYRLQLLPEDLRLIEHLIRQAKTWALVDGLATDVVSDLLFRYPPLRRSMDRWARDPDFWVRRSALLVFLRSLRAGDQDFPRFARHADAMLSESEFFIRKAIGWVLRETAKRNPSLVRDWLTPRAHMASGITVREAVKYLPARDRRRLLEAQRTRLPAD